MKEMPGDFSALVEISSIILPLQMSPAMSVAEMQ